MLNFPSYLETTHVIKNIR